MAFEYDSSDVILPGELEPSLMSQMKGNVTNYIGKTTTLLYKK